MLVVHITLKRHEVAFVFFVDYLQLDCDGDVLALTVEQKGKIACHTGRNSCFFRVLTQEGWRLSEPVLKDPKEIYADG